MDIILGIVVLITAAIIIVVDVSEHRKKWRQEDAEDAAFERHRAERQAEFDRHRKAVVRRVLIETCETIYIGRWQS